LWTVLCISQVCRATMRLVLVLAMVVELATTQATTQATTKATAQVTGPRSPRRLYSRPPASAQPAEELELSSAGGLARHKPLVLGRYRAVQGRADTYRKGRLYLYSAGAAWYVSRRLGFQGGLARRDHGGAAGWEYYEGGGVWRSDHTVKLTPVWTSSSSSSSASSANRPGTATRLPSTTTISKGSCGRFGGWKCWPGRMCRLRTKNRAGQTIKGFCKSPKLCAKQCKRRHIKAKPTTVYRGCTCSWGAWGGRPILKSHFAQ